VVTVLMVQATAAVAVQLDHAQRESRGAAERRFEQRARISAALTQSALDALGRPSARELGRDFRERGAVHRQRLTALVKRGVLGYAVVIEARGRIRARIGHDAPSRGTNRIPGVLSGVRRTPAGPMVELEVPFTTSAGTFVLVEWISVAYLRRSLERILRRVRIRIAPRSSSPIGAGQGWRGSHPRTAPRPAIP